MFLSIRPILLGLLLCVTQVISAQTTILLRNYTNTDLTISLEQTGNTVVPISSYQLDESFAPKWSEDKLEIFETDRDNVAVADGDTAYYTIKLEAPTDTIDIRVRLIGHTSGTNMAFAVTSNGWVDTWRNDGAFHQIPGSIDGEFITIKYKAENSDASQSRDVLFSVQQADVYNIPQAEFEDPNVLNVISYNIQMLPFGVSGLPDAELRADEIPSHFSIYQDVVIFQEAFDETPREDHLVPAMIAAGFPYNSGILNDTTSLVPNNGGVIIFSRWPIDTTAEIKYSACGPNSADCLSQKGMKYAAVNKLGKKYHIFGTHMDAGSDSADVAAKNIQMGEIRQFIESRNIPEYEAVVFGGDFNVSPISGDRLYLNFIDSLAPIIPNHSGFYGSTLSADTGKVIDHVWGSSKHLIPLSAMNDILVFKTISDTLWDLGLLSDHHPVNGRFVYPDASLEPNEVVLCTDDSYTYELPNNAALSYQWTKGSQALGTGNSYTVTNASAADDGSYACDLTYSVTLGDPGSHLYSFFFPNGTYTINADITTASSELVVDDVLCLLSVDDALLLQVSVYPNPFSDQVVIESPIADELQISITDLMGKLVYTGYTTEAKTQISLIHQPAGIYLVRLQNSNGSKVVRSLKQ